MLMLRIIKDKFIPIYFCFLFILLLFIYFPSFFDPPRSDAWPAYYFFHHLNTMPGTFKWLHVLNYDPIHQVNFYPLAHLIMYIQYLIFGSNFVYFHILHFILYCIFILLLYKFAIIFYSDRLLTFAFISVFTFLFSHFDIIIWVYHTHIVFSFCLFLLGFILYINFLKTGKNILLFFTTISFLLAMLCYATFMLWPFAIIILSYIDGLTERNIFKRKKLIFSYFSVLGTLYFLYIIIFFMTRAIGTYDRPLFSFNNFFSIRDVMITIFSIFFNILYNGILVNVAPISSCPGRVYDNVFEIGGLITLYEAQIVKIVFISGVFSLILFSLMLIYLIQRKEFAVIKILFFLCFLLFSEFFLLFYLRIKTNNLIYIFQQFRYQYILNVFIILMLLLILSKVLMPSKKRKTIIGSFLLIVLILNIYCSKCGISFVSSKLVPLRKIIYDIKKDIKNGQINVENKLYIDDDITERLPRLCWNKFMGGRYMKGTYQWMFTKEEIKCFSFTIQEAKWVISDKDFSIVKK